MYQVVVETDDGQLVVSNIPISPDRLTGIREHLLRSPQVQNVYATPATHSLPVEEEDIDEFINSLVW